MKLWGTKEIIVTIVHAQVSCTMGWSAEKEERGDDKERRPVTGESKRIPTGAGENSKLLSSI